ncbi:M14 family metallopeptidase [Rudaea cellulosilytica]|uniref:M14 family metallopeptidase n=1 Tax=Rudaea cellulosilytica TaxID=540746 RepID=UPI00039A9794
MMKRVWNFAIGVCLLAVATAAAQAADWTTPAEAAHFKTTPSYADTRAYLEKLAAAAPDRLKLTRFGVSPEGRDLMLVVAASGGEFTPEAARASGKEIVFVQAGIHAGEIEGKDAGLMLLRDLVDAKAAGARTSPAAERLKHALDHAILLYLPIFNVDGHENSNPYLRINQNGPAEMGFRATAQNLNLNRDYIKAYAPEMQAWLALWNAWLPDFLADIHTTDGADYRYDLTWYSEDWGPLDNGVKAWQDTALKKRIFAATNKRGHLLSPYLELKDHRDITKGIENFGSGQRFSTGYVALQNRAALLVETHMLKPYEVRVRVIYDLVTAILDDIRAHPGELRRVVEAADRNTIARANQPDATLPILFAAGDKPVAMILKGFDFTQTKSEISGDIWTQYDPARPKDYSIPNWRDLVVAKSAMLPVAYLVPAGWPQVIAKLKLHGLRVETTTQPLTLAVQRYQIDDPQWASTPFEGHLMLRKFVAKTENATLTFPPGSAVVRMDQRAANVAVNLLEPDAPDSLLRWGTFNAIFEQKESADARVLEKLARDMLAQDTSFKAEFEERLKNDAGFAADPRARLEFFYRRSPWYAKQNIGAYPVVKLDAAALAMARAAP